ncbi:unnamed protein product [Hydatigera taeniaeformis]|uniref:Uncharacterized protein n=1 Tax=Hydatigena taeniaeformis TaxID=6205 RepID=A0A0R3WUG1_HYDTA|nr:unnamed protein product [Hydatigera taeniaeformis]
MDPGERRNVDRAGLPPSAKIRAASNESSHGRHGNYPLNPPNYPCRQDLFKWAKLEYLVIPPNSIQSCHLMLQLHIALGTIVPSIATTPTLFRQDLQLVRIRLESHRDMQAQQALHSEASQLNSPQSHEAQKAFYGTSSSCLLSFTSALTSH